MLRYGQVDKFFNLFCHFHLRIPPLSLFQITAVAVYHRICHTTFVNLDVSDSIVNGKLLMRNRQVLTLDEEKILWQAEKYFTSGEVSE